MRRLKLYIFLFFLIISTGNLFAQREFIRLSSTVNHPAYNNFHPFVSGDGLTLIYLNDYTDYEGLSMYESSKKTGMWEKGTELPRLVNRPDLNFEGGHSLNFDGTFMIITSRKHGLGGYELWYSEKTNGNWSVTKNFGAPVNSALNDAAGVLSPDGQEMYYMRCARMDELSASGCKLYYTQKKFDRWMNPTPLPENVNKYNPQMPRILGDGETLIFSSDIEGGKGGYDLYFTRKTEEGWTDPVNLEFANTAQDDKFVSVPAKGSYLYASRPGERKNEIVQLLIPDEFKPKSVYKITGKVLTGDNSISGAEGIVFDAVNRSTFIRFPVDNTGTFSLALPEGTTYDVSINPSDKNYWYFSKLYILDSVPSRDRETVKVVFEKIETGKPLTNENLIFKANSAEVSDASSFELRRLTALLNAQPDLNLKVVTHLYDYQEDSIASDPDLTEIRRDTVYERINKLIPQDHLTTSVKDTVWLDSLLTNGIVLTGEYDTLMVMIDVDSIHFQSPTTSLTVPALEEIVTITYHNDRSEKEAEAIKAALVSRGIDPERITTDFKVHKEDLYDSSKPKRQVELILLEE
ncbi:MAG: hypothetical protein ACNS60_15590 [Candidatus Cyclobacteriaceae bacterium M2_1C_046]